MGRPQHSDMAPATPLGDEGAVVPPSDATNTVDANFADFDTENIDMEQEAGYFALPAHIAARFYKTKSAARRKSSATSSRRNSLSSVHSHGSSLSHRRQTTGSQSNYVAQHLRRASIIESRKARLADRAAHAEQVRLRAALVKAAPRGSISNSEEKALAAQLAKEKYLAKVAAACAEEVARAKRIAEEVKERKLAEEARVRLEMEERQVEAEKRRAEYQRNLQARRARRADSSEKKLGTLEEVADVDEEAVLDEESDQPDRSAPALTEDQAARRLQRTYRLHLRHKVVQEYCNIDLFGRTKRDSFEDMTALVADTNTIEATTAILTQIGLQDNNDENAALNTRTFLSAFMLTAHPVTVLNNKNGAQEQDLLAKSTELISQFEAAVSRLAKWNNFSPNATQLETLSQAYSAFTSAFAAWRLQDSSVLIEGMVASFVELDAIWQTVKDDTRGEVASDYREGIRDNQVMLLSRIRKLAGPDRADFLIKKAIRESRKKRPKKRPTAEVRPRGVEPVRTEASIAESSLDSGVESPVDAVQLPSLTLESPSGEVQLGKLFTPMPSNRVLTHELAINNDYRLEDSKTTMEGRDVLYRHLCDQMKRAIEAGSGGVWTLSMAENVREKLLRMLKPGNSMHTLISDTLDPESINRQCQQGVFSYDGFFEFMSNILPKLCAPFRDAEIRLLVEELQSSNTDVNAMIEKLFKILRAVDILSLDYTNFMIMNAAPTLVREAPGYEHRMFAKDLDSGVISLDKTKGWWRSSYAALCAEADRRDPEGIRNPADRPNAHKVYAHALLSLAAEQGELQDSIIPEILALDTERLQRIRREVIRLTIVGAILLTAKNLLRRDSRSQWKAEANRIWQLLTSERFDAHTDDLSTSQKAFSILDNAHNMPPSTKQHLSSTITRFFAQAAALSSPTHSTSVRLTDPVLKVLFQRLKAHIGSRLYASTSSERVRAASGASEALASFGMPEFTAQVGSIVDTLEKVREVDWKAHGVWHESIYRDLSSAPQGSGA